MNIINTLNQINVPKFSKDIEINKIVNLIEKKKEKTITITFFGTFKSGKSSIINTLLGAKILPTRTTTATSVVTKVFYSEILVAYIIKMGVYGEIVKEIIRIDDIETYVLLKKKTLNKIEYSNIKEVWVGIPSLLLKQGVILVDTPGLDDDKALTDISLNELKNTDIAIIVYNATKFMSMEEKKYAARISELLRGNVIFAVNKMDLVMEDKESVVEVAEYFLADYNNKLIGKKNIVYTNANDKAPDIKQLNDIINQKLNKNIISDIVYLSRLSTLLEEFENNLNKELNLWDSYRNEYEQYQKKHANTVASLADDMNTKMMHLSTRINNVRYNINKYLEPFRNMCISVANDENLLTKNKFNSYMLSHCIEETSIVFASQFRSKLKKLFNEFSVNFDLNFNVKKQVTSTKIDMYLTSKISSKNSLLGGLTLSIFGEDAFNEVSALIGTTSDEQYLTA